MGFRTIFNDVTAGTAVNASTSTIPQVIKTFNLDVTDDELIAVTAIFTITSTGTVVASSIPLQIVVGSNSYSVPVAMPVGAIPFSQVATITFPCVSRAGDTINVQAGTATVATATISVNVVGFYIQAWSGGKGGT